IYAEITGYGTTADAFRMTDSHPEGRGAIACMKLALEDSALPPSSIGYINAHGTSTQVNDKTESLAIKNVFGDGAYTVPISSSKRAAIRPAELRAAARSRFTLVHAVRPPPVFCLAPSRRRHYHCPRVNRTKKAVEDLLVLFLWIGVGLLLLAGTIFVALHLWV